MNQKQKRALITVGTTQFQQLIKTIDSESFIQLLKKYNYKIIFQIGRGKYIPVNGHQYFKLDPQISKIYQNSDLIICHGGAGTLLQCLLFQKKIISVVNDTLAGNHQKQIVNKLAQEGYILGFNSIQELKEKGLEKIEQYLKIQGIKKKFKSQINQNVQQTCILNKLVFEI